jgi:hypothetical protein
MVFSKRFPRATEGSVYPKWVEISLTEEEEKEIEQVAREENAKLFRECIEDSEKIVAERNLKTYQTDIISIASSLFDKRASHVVYLKERKCKEKFDSSK